MLELIYIITHREYEVHFPFALVKVLHPVH